MTINGNTKFEIQSLNMSKVIDVEAKVSAVVSYKADFTECYDKGYIELNKSQEGKIRRFKISKNIISVF